MKAASNFFFLAGFAIIILGVLGLLSPWLQRHGVAFHFPLSPNTSPFAAGAAMIFFGLVIRRRSKPVDQPSASPSDV